MFNLEFIWESIKAFNVNAFSSLAYIFMTNGWFFPIAISAGLSIFMLLIKIYLLHPLQYH